VPLNVRSQIAALSWRERDELAKPPFTLPNDKKPPRPFYDEGDG
jgi:hypothetical protein